MRLASHASRFNGASRGRSDILRLNCVLIMRRSRINGHAACGVERLNASSVALVPDDMKSPRRIVVATQDQVQACTSMLAI